MPDKDCTCLFREEAALWRNLAKSFATYQTSEEFPYHPNARQPRRTVGLCGTLRGMSDVFAPIELTRRGQRMRQLNGCASAYVATMAHNRFKEHCAEDAACHSGSQYVFDNSPAGDDARSLFCLLMEQAALDDSARYAAERGAA